MEMVKVCKVEEEVGSIFFQNKVKIITAGILESGPRNRNYSEKWMTREEQPP